MNNSTSAFKYVPKTNRKTPTIKISEDMQVGVTHTTKNYGDVIIVNYTNAITVVVKFASKIRNGFKKAYMIKLANNQVCEETKKALLAWAVDYE